MKLSLFANDMTLHTEPKDSTRKLLEVRSEFSKAAGYKINMQKLVAFLYANYKLKEREIKKAILFTTASKRINT